ncbi:acyl-CoA carboxylase subunit epsilon [Streptomyces sp. UH6]|uniref:acyl-CoA carboxylase subunit epsilon n=1 Tax=Streptomyces sp. UH6 TaxID=2748379 RepID=UPI00211E8E49|nr:acyl-CoA carboxylase subunit epsilon [Streptomyces sp. UH6]
MPMDGHLTNDAGGPVLRVERGRASDEELAALTAVLLSLPRKAGAREEVRPRTASGWWERRTDYEAPGSWH